MTKISPHPWHRDKADEAAAFYASKVEPGKHIGRLNVRARVDQRDGNPRTVDCVVCHAMAFAGATIAQIFGRRLRVVARSLTP